MTHIVISFVEDIDMLSINTRSLHLYVLLLKLLNSFELLLVLCNKIVNYKEQALLHIDILPKAASVPV